MSGAQGGLSQTAAIVLLAIAGAGCTSGLSDPDSGAVDDGEVDAGETDAGLEESDGGNFDAGAADAGTPCTLVGPLTIASPDEWSALLDGGCDEVEGDLRVEAPGFSTLGGPATALKRVGSLRIAGNSLLQALEFPALEAVLDGGLAIESNPSLGAQSFPQLRSIRGSLRVSANDGLAALQLPALGATGTGISVESNPALTTVDLGALVEAPPGLFGTAHIAFVSNGALASLTLGSLRRVVGGLWVRDCGALATLELPALQSVAGAFDVSGTALTQLTVPALQRVGQANISGNPMLVRVDFPALTLQANAFSKGGVFQISSNPALTSLSLPRFQTVDGRLWLTSLTALTALDLPELIAAQEFGISGNTALVSLTVPKLASVAPTGSFVLTSGLVVQGNAQLPVLRLPALRSAFVAISVNSNASLTTFEAPLLNSSPSLTLLSNASLTGFSLGALTQVQNTLEVRSNPLLRQCLVDGLHAQLTTAPTTYTSSGNNGSPNTCP